MKKLFTYSSVALIILITVTSCNKKQITASFQNTGGSSYAYFKRKSASIEPKQESLEKVVTTEKTQNTSAINTNVEIENAEATMDQAPSAVNELASVDKNAIIEHVKQMSSQDKKDMRTALKNYKKQWKRKDQTSSESSSNDEFILLLLLTLFVPPLAVYLIEGDITTNFWIDLILTLLFWLPGVLFALIILLS